MTVDIFSRIRGWCALAVTVLGMGLSQASITYTATFDADSLVMETDTVGASIYTRVSYPGLYSGGEPGHPSLPVKYVRLSIPCTATRVTVTATGTGEQTRQTLFPVIPTQEDRSISHDDGSFTEPDSTAYSLNSFRPSKLGLPVEDGFLMGENHILTVAINPVTYNPHTRAMNIYENVRIELDFNGNGGGGGTIMPQGLLPGGPITPPINPGYITTASMSLKTNPLISTRQEMRTRGIETTQLMVENPQMVASQLPVLADSATVSHSMSQYGPYPYPDYEYVVITTDSLTSSFAPLVAWKRQKGLNAGVISIESILGNQRYEYGDTISNIVDDAGKLRAFLTEATAHGLQYVLFGGDYTNMPIRYANAMLEPNKAYDIIPSDVYFTDLNGNWDSNNNGVYGEYGLDSVDLSYELCVGRLLCRTKEEVTNYVNKLLLYEKKPGNGNLSYLGNAISTMDVDRKLVDNYKSYTRAQLIYCYPNLYEMYGDPSLYDNYDNRFGPNIVGNNVIEEMNNHKYGFCHFSGHGTPQGISISRSSWGGYYAFITKPGNTLNYIYESANSIDKLTNKNSPFVAYSIACSTMPFDCFYNDDNTPPTDYNENEVPINFGRSILCGKDYGAVIYLGNTRFGWTRSSPQLSRYFYKLLNSSYSSMSLAEMEHRSKIDFCYHDDKSYFVSVAHNVLGCPETKIWRSPSLLNNSGLTLTLIDNLVRVNNLPDSVSVALSNCDGSTDLKVCDNGIASFSNISTNSVVTAYGNDKIPYIFPTYFQNETVRNDNYFYVNNLFVGNDVLHTRIPGNFVIDNCNMVVKSDQNVFLQQGFVVTNSGKMDINCNGLVMVDGPQVINGGKLFVICGVVAGTITLTVDGTSEVVINDTVYAQPSN